MNNYCTNCGTKLDENKKCSNCQTEVLETRLTETPKTETTPEQATKEKKYIITIITLYILAIIMRNIGTMHNSLYFLVLLSFPTSLSSIILLIFARITTKNKTIKILFTIFIISLILSILGAIFIFVTCTTMASNCNG